MGDELTPEQEFAAKLFGPKPEPSKDQLEPDSEKPQAQSPGAGTQPGDPGEDPDPARAHNQLIARLLRGPIPAEKLTGEGDE